METRRETKRQVIALRTMLRSQGLSAEQRRAMEANIVELRQKLDSVESQIDAAEITARRTFLQKNKGLFDIFNTFWVTLMSYTMDGYLSKEGYSKFHHAVEIALAGEATFANVDEQALNADWTYDRLLYGNLNKTAFFDMLFELIETWTEIVDPTYYAAFAWALLDSIADTTAQPPKLRPLREMRCITKMENESSMIKAYVNKKKIRAALSIESEMMQRIPEVQKRLHARRHGRNLDDAQQSMVEALSLQAADSIEFIDDDAQSLHTASSLQMELQLQQQNWQDDEREEDHSDEEEEFEDSDCELPNGEEILQNSMRASGDINDLGEGILPHLTGSGSPGSGRRKFSVTNSHYGLGRPTASFLSYCQKRRSTRVLLNGVYGVGGSLSLEGGSTRSLSTGSGVIDMTSMVILPSVMSSQYSDNHSESDGSYSVDGDVNLRGSQHSLNNSQHSLTQPYGQSRLTGVMLIDSPTKSLHPYGSNPQLSPFGGKVGDKARFSQFIASGKRLGSFARGYLATHDVNSGLNTDAFTNGNKGVISTINSQRSHAEALKMTKTPNPQAGSHLHSSSHPHLHSQSVGQLATLVEESLNSNNAPLGELSLMGKSMYVPHTNNSSAQNLIKPAPKQALSGHLTQKGLHAASRSGATLSLTPIKTDLPDALDGPGTAESEAFTDNLTDGGDSHHESTGFTPVRAPRSNRAGASANSQTSSARQRKLAPVATKIPSGRAKASAMLEEGAEFGEAVDDDGTGSQYFNVLETQLSGMSMFRPELTSELLSQNSAHQSFSEYVSSFKSADSGGNGGGGSSKSKLSKSGKHYLAPPVNGPELKAPEQGNRGCFLLVESQAPPLEKVKTIFRPASRGALANSPPRSPTGQTLPMGQFIDFNSRPASEQFGFTHSSSEILPPEIRTSSVINLLSPAPNDASFAALLGLPEQKSPAKTVSLINFPFGGPSKSVASVAEGGRARSNSNVSYADSDVSYDSPNHMKLLESGNRRHKGGKKQASASKTHVQQHFLARSASMEGPHLDTMSGSSAPRSIIGRPGTNNNKKISPLLVMDPSVGGSHQQSRASHEQGQNINSAHSPKRGTNLAIVQPHHLPMKPEYATFPQGMYYNVVKHALNLRQQPTISPSWDHTRASKAVRLSTLKRPVDASLSLTTAAMNVSNANKLAEVIRHTEHHQKILGEKLVQPSTAPKKPPLTINITSSENNDALKYGSALENADASKLLSGTDSIACVSPDGSHRESQLHRGSFTVPSAANINANMLSGNAIPAPDALLESLVMLRGHTPAMSDDVFDTESLGGSLGPGASLAGNSQASSPGKNGSPMPSLLIKPCTSAVNLHALQHSQAEKVEKTDSNSPSKGAYFDPQGKLQVKDVHFEQKDLFEIHRNINTIQTTGKSTAKQFQESQLIPSQTAPLVPIKHPYLTMNGTKHVLPDKILSSIVSVRKSSSLYEPEQSQAESVFLGNSSGVLIRDSTLGHTSDHPAHAIPWLPRGTLEPLEHDRSNQVLGKREALDLQRSAYGETNRQVLTIRSQKAIREAFEGYVNQHLTHQHNNQLAAVEFHQLNRAQQEALLQQMQTQPLQQQTAPMKTTKGPKGAKKQKAPVAMTDITE